jgi:hypothetical protein
MTASQTSNVGTPDPVLREPSAAEVERVVYLFGNAPLIAEARLIAAARSRPVERFIAALAWWPEGKVGRFQLTCRPGVDRVPVAGRLIDQLADSARRAGMETIQCATLLTEDNEWLGILRAHGFECEHSEHSFEVAYRDAWLRVMKLHQKHRPQIPAGWRTESIRGHPPEAALELIAPHRLMPPAEIRSYWAVNAPSGFEPDLSCLLFNGQRPFGAFLARQLGEGLCIDAQVVRETNPRLRSLGDLFMLYHAAQRVAPDGPIRWIWFRSGQTEHRQTANLARRMGGRELGRSYLMQKKL